MTDIFKRMRKEAEEKQRKTVQGYSALFSKPKANEKSAEIKSWDPSGKVKKTEPTKPAGGTEKKPAKPAIDASQFLGRFFVVKTSDIGAGGTSREQTIEIHYFAKEMSGEIHLFMATNTGKPTNIETGKISSDDFKENYKLCSEHNCPFN